MKFFGFIGEIITRLKQMKGMKDHVKQARRAYRQPMSGVGGPSRRSGVWVGFLGLGSGVGGPGCRVGGLSQESGSGVRGRGSRAGVRDRGRVVWWVRGSERPA